MAFRAQIRCAIAEGVGCRVLDVVNAMTINTSRNILIALLRQCRAMNTFLIGVINCTVTLGASLRNYQPSAQQELPCGFVCKASLRVRVMAIGANRSVFISCCE